jgi:drug/metabolite transporter (DMT)-like permease
MMMRQALWTTRRILWTAGVGFVGFFIGGKGSGLTGSGLGLLWGGSIGYGFGSIFDQKLARKRVVVYWGITLGLVGAFFGLVLGAPEEPSVAKETVAGTIGAAVGILFGSLIGIIQLWRLRQKSQTPPPSGSVA